MPDPKALHGFLKRTQNWLQRSMDEGDQEGASYYEGLMDRGNALAERMISMQQQQPGYVNPHQEQGQPVQVGVQQGQQTVEKPSGFMPVTAGNTENPAFPPLGRVMMDSNYGQPQYSPGMMYQPQGASSPTANQQTPQASTSMPGQLPNTQKVQGQPLFDLSKLNGDKAIVDDLNGELTSPQATQANALAFPFAKPKTAEDKLFGAYPKNSPGVNYKGPTEPAKAAPATPAFDSMVYTEGLPTEWPEEKSMSDFLNTPIGGGKPRTPFKGTPVGDAYDWLTTRQPVFSSDPKSMGAGYVEGTGDAAVRPAQTPSSPVSDEERARILAHPETISGEPEKAPSKYESDPSFRERIDMMGAVKKTASDPFEKEFLTRVERELGKKPSFFTLETLAMLLLMGAPRAYQNFQNQKQWYQSGKRDIAKEMRSEMNTKNSNSYRLEKDKMDREIQMKRIAAQYATGAMKETFDRFAAEYDRLGKAEAAILANPANDPMRPSDELLKIRQAQRAVLDEWDRVRGTNYGGVVK